MLSPEVKRWHRCTGNTRRKGNSARKKATKKHRVKEMSSTKRMRAQEEEGGGEVGGSKGETKLKRKITAKGGVGNREASAGRTCTHVFADTCIHRRETQT